MVNTGPFPICMFRTTRLFRAYVAIISALGIELGLMVNERQWAVATGPVMFLKTLLLTRLIKSAPLRTTAGVRLIA